MEFADPRRELLAILGADRPWRSIQQVLLKMMPANLQRGTAQRIAFRGEDYTVNQASPYTDSADRGQRTGIGQPVLKSKFQIFSN
jgi:hypothetical protein